MTAEQSIRNIERLMDAVNAATQVEPDPRADLVDLFEAHAETHDDKSWIQVEEAVDLVMDRDAETPPGAIVEWAWRTDYGAIRPVTSETAAQIMAEKFNGTAISRTIGAWAEVQS